MNSHEKVTREILHLFRPEKGPSEQPAKFYALFVSYRHYPMQASFLGHFGPFSLSGASATSFGWAGNPSLSVA